MRVQVLSSGSRGNTTYIECGDTRILIDIGNSCKYVVEKLRSIGVEAASIDGIFLTHTHNDHIKGLKVFLNKFKTKVYLTDLMREELPYVENYYLIEDTTIRFKDFVFEVIKTSHDVCSSVGYIVHGDGKSIVYITDTGYINQKYFSKLNNCEIYILESNHDIEMLNNGSYSFKLRQRILSDKGHLSNYDCARYLSTFVGDRTKCIMLAHLSQDNNTRELAYQTLEERLVCEKKIVDKIIVTEQDHETEVVEV